jgi:hypothetical protein
VAVVTMASSIKKMESISVRSLLADTDLTLEDLKVIFDFSGAAGKAVGDDL